MARSKEVFWSLMLVKVVVVLIFLVLLIPEQAIRPKSSSDGVWMDEALGYRIEKVGAIQYLLDEEGERISGGYHRYFLKDGAVYGVVGAREEIVVSAGGRINSRRGFRRWR